LFDLLREAKASMPSLEAEIILRDIEGDGFHRTLLTGVRASVPWAVRDLSAGKTDIEPSQRVLAGDGSPCVVAVVESMPREVYVDFDEAKEQRRFQVSGVPLVVGVGFDGGIDVEKPAEVSIPFKISQISTNVTLESASADAMILHSEFRLPLHFRYQAPGNEAFAPATVHPPIGLWIGCPTTGVGSLGSGKPSFPLDSDLADLNWISVQGAPQGPGAHDVTVEIPIGILSQATMVHSVTAVVTMLGALFLLWITQKASHNNPESEKKSE